MEKNEKCVQPAVHVLKTLCQWRWGTSSLFWCLRARPGAQPKLGCFKPSLEKNCQDKHSSLLYLTVIDGDKKSFTTLTQAIEVPQKLTIKYFTEKNVILKHFWWFKKCWSLPKGAQSFHPPSPTHWQRKDVTSGLYYKHILTIVSDDRKWRQYYKCAYDRNWWC